MRHVLEVLDAVEAMRHTLKMVDSMSLEVSRC